MTIRGILVAHLHEKGHTLYGESLIYERGNNWRDYTLYIRYNNSPKRQLHVLTIHETHITIDQPPTELELADPNFFNDLDKAIA